MLTFRFRVFVRRGRQFAVVLVAGILRVRHRRLSQVFAPRDKLPHIWRKHLEDRQEFWIEYLDRNRRERLLREVDHRLHCNFATGVNKPAAHRVKDILRGSEERAVHADSAVARNTALGGVLEGVGHRVDLASDRGDLLVGKPSPLSLRL